MPDVREYQIVVEDAERAARDGDLASAQRYLREALRIQETTLGPTHVNLASTLNNLAVVSETLGHVRDAEQYFRRAYAIASASRPATDPLVVTSLQNLTEFCEARGLPLEDWPGIEDAPAARVVASLPVTRTAPRVPPAAAPTPAPAVASPSSPSPTRAPHTEAAASRNLPWAPIVAVAVAALVAVAIAGRFWGSASDPGSTTTDAPAPSAAVERGAQDAPAAELPPSTAAAPPTPVPTAETPRAVTPDPPAPPAATAAAARPSAAASGVRIVVADVCASLTTGGAWRCTPVGTPAAAGRASFYTRVASPVAMRLEHRWYQGTTLKQRVTLAIAANPREGYRTFSRQTLSPGSWRVELRATDGTVLHEAAFDVR